MIWFTMDLMNEVLGFYAEGAGTLQSWVQWGTNIFEEEWDALIILDACRVDALKEVKQEYDFLQSIESRTSRGSTSKEWIENTFTEKHRDIIESTAYVTANPYAENLINGDVQRLPYKFSEGASLSNGRIYSLLGRTNVVPASDFCNFINLWDAKSESEYIHLHPEQITDQAIQTARETSCDRIIIHYMQPHHPFINTNEPEQWHDHPFAYLKETGDLDNVWDGYLNNLRLVLDSLEILLNNMTAERAIITADHGELFGEWNQHAHFVGFPHPVLRKVPWVVTSATDTMNYKPETDMNKNKITNNQELDERLSALGYK